jgi:mutator protein MutT
MWEFPGGKIEPNETPEQAVVREIREEVDIAIEPDEPLPPIEHQYPERFVRLHPYLCKFLAGELQPIGCEQAIWIDVTQLSDYQFPEANRELIETLIGRFG